MATKLKPVDVVLVAFAWTASILAKELTDTGLQVLAIERGKFRDTVPDFATTHIQDELKYAVRGGLFEDPARETLTFRNSLDQTALPMRHLGSFNPASGVGGAGIHWNGQNWRFLPTDFTIRSQTEARYGKNFIPADMTIQDWGVTYDDLEPYYDKFEYLCGISGQAGNVQGKIQSGGNPFEGPRARGYPLPPLKRIYATVLFDKAAKDVGLTRIHRMTFCFSQRSRRFRYRHQYLILDRARRWRASSPRSRPNAQRVKYIDRGMRRRPMCSTTSNAS